MVLFALLLTLAALRSFFGYKAVYRDAVEEWPSFRLTHKDLVKDINAEQFKKAYARAHGPRGPLYGAVTLLAAAIFTPLFMVVVTGLYQVFVAQPAQIGGGSGMDLADEVRKQFRRDGPLVYSFFLFFGLIASWGAVAFIIAKRFHGNRPGSLEDEIRAVRGDEALPDAPVRRSRPKWSPLVKTDDGLKLPDAHNKS